MAPATLDNPGLGVEDPQLLNPYAYARNTPTSLGLTYDANGSVRLARLGGVPPRTGVAPSCAPTR